MPSVQDMFPGLVFSSEGIKWKTGEYVTFSDGDFTFDGVFSLDQVKALVAWAEQHEADQLK